MTQRLSAMTEASSSSSVANIADYKPITTKQTTAKMNATTSGGGRGGGGNGMENRLASLETNVTHLQSDVTDIKKYGLRFSAFLILLIVGFSGWQSHKFDRVEDKFDRVEDKFDRFDERLDRVELSVGKIETRLDNIEVKVSNIETILLDIRDNLNKETK